MKKIMYAIGLGLISGSLYAACVGPYCYDDTGASIQAGVSLPLLPLATVNLTSPNQAGQMIMCSDCVRSAVCVSSGTGKGAYVILEATGTFVGATWSGLQHCI